MRPLIGGVINKFNMITIMVKALKIGDIQDRFKSFIGTKMNPKHRLTF